MDHHSRFSYSCAILSLAFYFTLTIASTEMASDRFRYTFEVHVINGFTDGSKPLIIHCKSKDDDLGEHSLKVGEDFRWHFKINIWFSTLFFCDFNWGQMSRTFNVFTFRKEGKFCSKTGNCYWLPTERGFYLSNDNFTWVKQYEWR